MYPTKGVDAIATITELRAETADLLDLVQGLDNGILIQRNNIPQAVLLSWDLYIDLKNRVDFDKLIEETAA